MSDPVRNPLIGVTSAPNRSAPIRVTIVESDVGDRVRLADRVARHSCFTIVGMADSIREGIAVITAQTQDLILVAPLLSDGGGGDLISRVVDTGIKSTVVLSSHRESELTIWQILEALDRFRAESSRVIALPASPRPPTAALDLPSPLTLRETEVLQSLAKGLRFGDIAQLLSISPHTVTAHVRKIYQKLSVNSRAEAIFEARQLRIVE